MSAETTALILAAAGLIPTAVSFSSAALRLYRRLRRKRNGPVLAVARHAVIQEGLRVLAHAVCILGIALMYCPAIQDVRPDVRTMLFAGLSGVLCGKSLLAQRYRRKMERVLEGGGH
jgi:hypothetical protein